MEEKSIIHPNQIKWAMNGFYWHGSTSTVKLLPIFTHLFHSLINRNYKRVPHQAQFNIGLWKEQAIKCNGGVVCALRFEILKILQGFTFCTKDSQFHFIAFDSGSGVHRQDPSLGGNHYAFFSTQLKERRPFGSWDYLFSVLHPCQRQPSSGRME